MHRNGFITVLLLMFSGQFACTKITADLKGRSCLSNTQCITGWTCDPEKSECVEPNIEACPAVEGTPCLEPGILTSCAERCDVVDCAEGCRRCEGVGRSAIWGACECQIGTAERCSSCSDDCRDRVLGAVATCVAADAVVYDCSYTGSCFTGWVDVNGRVSDGCECVIDCSDKCGGSDGCGGRCPDNCANPLVCGVGNTCICVPSCEGRCGGDDGCSGTCPDTCISPFACNSETSTCYCVPQCDGRCAGNDGCSGACAFECTGQDVCDLVTETCVCTLQCDNCLITTGSACGGACISTANCLPGLCASGHLFPLKVTTVDSVPQGYSLVLELNHKAFVDAGAAVMGEDVSVLYFDGTGFTALNRVADYAPGHGWNSPNTQIWFSAVNTIPANSSTEAYYVLIGASPGDVLDDVRDIFVFADDFERPDATAPGGDWLPFSTNQDNAITIVNGEMAFVKTVEEENTPGADAPLFRTVTAGAISVVVHMAWDGVQADNSYAGVIALGQSAKMAIPPNSGPFGNEGVDAQSSGIGPYFGIVAFVPDNKASARRMMYYCPKSTASAEMCVLPAPEFIELALGAHRLRADADLTDHVINIFQADAASNAIPLFDVGFADSAITQFDRVRVLSRHSRESASAYRINDIVVRLRVLTEPTVALNAEITDQLCGSAK